MPRRSGNRRIEPRFDAAGGRGAAADLAFTEDDRIIQPSRRQKSSQPQRRRVAKTANPGRRKGRGRRRGLSGLLRRAFYWCLVLGLWVGIAGAAVTGWYAAKMPSVANWEIPDRPPNVRIVSVDGLLVANRGMTGGEAVGLHEMSPYIPQAVIAIEDRRFHSHFGVDPLGLARAVYKNLVAGRLSQGGSTITQQLAKNLFLKPDRTIERKVQEVLLALWLEQKYTKEQILEMYLNRVYFGSGAYGVEAAARRYFGKPASDVTLPEAALLAGLLKAPSRLSPARDPKAAEVRTQLVLAAMQDARMISAGDMRMALSAPATRAAAYWTGSEHYAADKVMEELPLLIGEIRSDVIVHSTVDLHLQKLAEKSIRRLIDEKGKEMKVSQGALIAMDNTGAVRATVGGYDYANSQFDRVSEARRQPGSAFKPFVFMAAVERGLTPHSVRRDAPVKIGNWQPGNFNNKFYGDVTLSDALAKSLNSVAVRLVGEVGAKAVIEAAWRLGIESDLQNNASIALGTSEVTPLELTAAFVPFANGGYRPFVHFIDKVTTPEGKVLWERRSGGIPRVVSAETVGMMNQMMAQTLASGTGRKAAFGWPAAGKTGTTQNSRDVWFVGYTANLTTSVWFGNDDGSPTNSATGGSLPALAWKEFMTAAHQGVPMAQLPAWSGVPTGGGFPEAPASDGAPVAQSGWSHDAVGDALSRTGSIDRPVPPGEVGAPVTRRVTSILDVLLGN